MKIHPLFEYYKVNMFVLFHKKLCVEKHKPLFI